MSYHRPITDDVVKTQPFSREDGAFVEIIANKDAIFISIEGISKFTSNKIMDITGDVH